jgi:hypothetical protein
LRGPWSFQGGSSCPLRPVAFSWGAPASQTSRWGLPPPDPPLAGGCRLPDPPEKGIVIVWVGASQNSTPPGPRTMRGTRWAQAGPPTPGGPSKAEVLLKWFWRSPGRSPTFSYGTRLVQTLSSCSGNTLHAGLQGGVCRQRHRHRNADLKIGTTATYGPRPSLRRSLNKARAFPAYSVVRYVSGAGFRHLGLH